MIHTSNRLTPIAISGESAFTVKQRKSLCLCKTLSPTFHLARILGLLPIKWAHKNNGCSFEKSLPWLCYTFLVTCVYIYLIIAAVDYVNMIKSKCLILVLDDITNAIYGYYIIILTLISVYKFPEWIKTLTKLSNVLKDGIFCESAMKTSILLQYGNITIVFITILVSSGLSLWFDLSEGYDKKFAITDVMYRMMQNISFSFYSLFMAVVIALTGILACFERLTINSLRYTPIHPNKGMDETNNINDYLGIINYKLCKGRHPRLTKFSNLSPAQTLEYLRILHEDVCSCIYSFNGSINPQLLLHTIIELTVLIIHWYAVIAYLVYTFKHPAAKTIHILNCISAGLHSAGLFLFLKKAQHLKNMVLDFRILAQRLSVRSELLFVIAAVGCCTLGTGAGIRQVIILSRLKIQGLIVCLLEYSTKLTTLEEHQQVRMFIEKLKQHRPFSASGVFTVDLGIAGPISANILTYVLVALQFEIPKE